MTTPLRLSVVRAGFGGGNDAMTYAALARLNGWDVTYWRDPPLSEEEAPGLRSLLCGRIVPETAVGADIVEAAELSHWWTQALCDTAVPTYPVIWQNLPWVDMNEYTTAILNTAAGFIARSSMAAELLRLCGVGYERIHVIHAAVDCERFCPVPPGEQMTTEWPVRILYAGRNTLEKGINDVVAALLSLPRELREKVQLVLAGGASLDIPDIATERLGVVPHHQMPGVYRSCDIFVYPTYPTQYWLEQWGLAVTEAMAVGLPVVTTDVGAFREMLPPEQRATWTIPARDWVGLRDRLAALIENVSLRQTLGRRNREWTLAQFGGELCAAGYRRAFGG